MPRVEFIWRWNFQHVFPQSCTYAILVYCVRSLSIWSNMIKSVATTTTERNWRKMKTFARARTTALQSRSMNPYSTESPAMLHTLSTLLSSSSLGGPQSKSNRGVFFSVVRFMCTKKMKIYIIDLLMEIRFSSLRGSRLFHYNNIVEAQMKLPKKERKENCKVCFLEEVYFCTTSAIRPSK